MYIGAVPRLAEQYLNPSLYHTWQEAVEQTVNVSPQPLRDRVAQALNVMASPGAGKTSDVTKTIEALRDEMRIGVIEGDIAGSIDTNTVLATGESPARGVLPTGNGDIRHPS